MYYYRLILTAIAIGAPASAWDNDYKHVAIFSVDGLHSSDVGKYIAQRPDSTIAALLKTGIEYTNAFTSGPSDSFPGTMNQFTGASPRTTGVWYDDTYDRTFYDPFSTSKCHCCGPPGAEVTYDESKDYNSTELFSGGIDPANLPQAIVDGKCQEIYPHSRLRVNTIWEIVHQAGKETAYTDKHPAYDIVRGPSGKGLTIGYFPEIAAIANTVDATITYDTLHVTAFLSWLAAKTPDHSEIQGAGLTTIPTLFGGNFQSVSVAQKTKGYVPGTLAFTPDLLKALDFVDTSLAKVVQSLKDKHIYKDTLIIIASKHGQAPINPSLYRAIDPALVPKATGVNVSFTTTDDIALIFLASHSDTATAVAGLRAHSAQLAIDEIISGPELIKRGYGNPATDPAVPDIIVKPKLGVIYTTSKAKIAEHGGLSGDDRKVACFISSPRLGEGKEGKEGKGEGGKKVGERVSTRQVAPTVLKALGLDPGALQGVKAQGTKILPEF